MAMRRRDFFACLGGAAAAPILTTLPGNSQQMAIPVIGYLSSKGETAEASTISAVRKGLAERKYIAGKNVNFIYRWSDGDYSRLPKLAADLVSEKVNVIAASGLPAALAAKTATSTIPIVFRLAIDPVAFHLASSFDRPGGNMTGVTMLFDPLTPKKLQLLHELTPGVTNIGFVINPKNQNAESHKQYAERAAKTLGLDLSVLTVSGAGDIEPAFAAARKAGIGAILIGDDPSFDAFSHELAMAAERFQLPAMYYVSDFVAAGGLISYGPSFDEMAQQEGNYLGRILEGARPADLPIQQPTKIELVINLKAAKALGIAMPPTLLASADEVIE
jgi:putative tryptophan/tyrosine transport system substrate-binding protein